MEWFFGTVRTVCIADVVWDISKDAHVNKNLEIYA